MKSLIGTLALFIAAIPAWTQENTPLRELAKPHQLEIGAAVGPFQLRNDEAYRETLAREFSLVTTENALKFAQTEPQQGEFTFENADTIIRFAEDHDMTVRGHTLIWYRFLPDWVENNEWSREEAVEVLRNHITKVVSRYKGRVQIWDVVNEIFEEDGSRRDSVWYKAIGPEFVEMAFRLTHEVDPEASLFYNDFSAENINAKSNAIYEMAKDFIERDVPLHGIGLQMHLPLDHNVSIHSLTRNIQRFADLGLQVHITELDVRIPTPASDEELQKQAEVYEEILRVALESPNVNAFITWGVTDRYSWIPGFFDDMGAALPFDEDYNPKPAYEAMRALLQATPANVKRWDLMRN